MKGRVTLLGLAAAGVLATSSLPALAQLDDFLCSSFNYKCAPEAPLAAPQLAPETPPADPAAKPHKKKMRSAKAKKASKAKAEGDAAAAPPPAAAPDAAAAK